MIEIRARVFVDRRRDPVTVRGRLVLPFDRRTKTRQRATLASGEEMAMMLPRGEVLRGGDLVATSDGRARRGGREPRGRAARHLRDAA